MFCADHGLRGRCSIFINRLECVLSSATLCGCLGRGNVLAAANLLQRVEAFTRTHAKSNFRRTLSEGFF